MLTEELARVALALHPDPHSILGAHREGDGWIVRALRPGASGVRLLGPGFEPVTMRATSVRGIFEATLTGAPGRYRIEDTTAGVTRAAHDPYSFGPTLGDVDLHLFAEGRHDHLHDKLGGHLAVHDGVHGARFAVWAPAAISVRVLGEFNGWKGEGAAMRRLSGGVWEIFLPDVVEGALYKYEIVTRRGPVEKSDPFGRAMEVRPQTASRLVRSRYAFGDAEWIAARNAKRGGVGPMSIYEVHLSSWKRKPREVAPGEPPLLPEESKRWLTYRELAHELVDYVADLGFSHIELLPVMEHPYDGSWGYQVSGYFAPTSRHGTPDDFKYFVDRCHERGLGVILDWVPAHFPRDASALGRFDGTPLFEHWDPRRGEHRQWETFVFDWGRPEVKNFLIASAIYWLEEFHIDGLRVDAVASMLYLDYGANHPSEWEPNVHGGRENLEAVAFLRELNDRVHERFPGAIVCAEESTSWPGVTRPTYAGGLGFDLKWNMGWMHDTLHYFSLDPIFRSFNHNLITFAMVYAWSERFLLPLSHDEVVHLKKSLKEKMPGDPRTQLATLRALYALMWAHPGRKLLFMGGEIGQTTEWRFDDELDWHLERHAEHRGLRDCLRDLNTAYRASPALFEIDDDPRSFRWIDANDASQSVYSFVRFPRSKLASRNTGAHVVVVGSFTPVLRTGYRIGVPRACDYVEVVNTDAATYGGTNAGNMGRAKVEAVPSHGFAQSIVLTLPPLSTLWLVPEDEGAPTARELEDEETERKARLAREAADEAAIDAARE
ncbi:MAG TPA: 1,4-alpha-glucan branching protein GlgB [Polyangiaceae bacterium]|nr:1,4-alpha-glucan branching protein GlgB [Polyangiaceae bacterium]